MDSINSLPPGEYISGITVKNLYGEFDYTLGPIEPSADPRILVLYGNNGTGKTTILKTIRDLLTSDFDSGCRTRISNTPFQSIAIQFLSGAVVEARRKPGDTIGAFRWSVSRVGQSSLELNVGVRAKNLSRQEEMDPTFRASYESLREALATLAPKINYLDDKRTFSSVEHSDDSSRFTRRRMPDGSMRHVLLPSPRDDDDPVQGVLGELMNIVRREAFFRFNKGTSNAQSIYTALINRLAGTSWQSKANGQESFESLVRRLREVQGKSEVLSKYGLVAPIDHSDMESALQTAEQAANYIIAEVLEPYIESSTARFDALNSLYEDIDTWVKNVNGFLFPKKIKFKVGEELQILSKGSKDLGPETLSSGERHLMFMMGKAFLMRSSSGLMLIDEPEISLNVKWQRDLVRALVEAFGGSGVQLIIATHSLEIASLYLGNVFQVQEVTSESSVE